MSKAVVKLFKKPDLASKAADELKAKGFKAEEIDILVSDSSKAKKLGAKATSDIGAALTKLGLPEDTAKYYEFSASMGGIIVSVKADDARLSQAREVLRTVDPGAAQASEQMWTSSPAFQAAGRMSASDPIDAKMTGDFRQY